MPGLWHARQFPRASGYPEDAATGIAAAALAYGLLHSGRIAADTPLRIRQGEAMGSPSEIGVAFRDGDPARGCWISGSCLPV
ncbi:MAG: PhzF family phenazine biosynthesis protein [Paracoccaceae bacterium]